MLFFKMTFYLLVKQHCTTCCIVNYDGFVYDGGEGKVLVFHTKLWMREGDLFPTDIVLPIDLFDTWIFFSPASLPTAILALYFPVLSLSLSSKEKKRKTWGIL